jgi:tetratricopeptide (TPR) repeat protein|tara:strand:- start:2249 stop:4126 length:1878 start_codon:yes stop_codon:yes gene_type:complete
MIDECLKVKNQIQDLYFLKKYDLASKIISDAEVSFPSDSDILYFKGLIEKDTDLFDNAILTFNRAIKLSQFKVRKELLVNLAECYLNVNLLDESIEIYNTLLKSDSNYIFAIEGLGKANLLLNKPELALSFFDKVFQLKPNHIDSYFNTATSYFLLNNFSKALDCYLSFVNTIELKNISNNKLINIYINISICYRNINSYNESIVFLKKAELLINNYHYILFNFGLTYVEMLKFEVAEDYFKKAYNLDNTNPLYAYNYCNILLMRGEKTLTKVLINKIIAEDPSFVKFLDFSSKIDCVPGDVFFNWINSLLNDDNISDSIKAKCEFGMFSILDKAGDYKDAFKHLKAGNDLFNSSLEKSITKSKAQHSIIKEFKFNLNYHPSKLGYNPIPIFIVGMPRSGTTLTEQILDSHDSVFGAGELTFMSDIISDYNIFSKKLLNNELLDLISTRYFKSIRDINNANLPYIVDKMPGNYFWLEIIKRAIPEAKIIHCTRNPMDTCLSIYSKNFISNFNSYYDLTDIAHSYIHYYQLMKSFRASLGNSSFLDFSYEELIMSQEVKVKELLEYCGLDYNEKCLKFYDNQRFVRTASSVQVKEDFYSKSINRWKNYQDELMPLFEILRKEKIIN